MENIELQKDNASAPVPHVGAPLVQKSTGLVTVWVDLGVGVAEETVKASFGAMDDFRAEVSTRANATLQFIDDLGRGGTDLGRKIKVRVDHVAQTALGGGEQALLAMCGAVRRTTKTVANQTVQAFVAEESAPN